MIAYVSFSREIRRINVGDHPAFHVGAFPGEVPTVAHRRRSPYRRVLASRRAPDVPAYGLAVAPPGAFRIRAKHPKRSNDAQRQTHGDESWNRRSKR